MHQTDVQRAGVQRAEGQQQQDEFHKFKRHQAAASQASRAGCRLPGGATSKVCGRVGLGVPTQLASWHMAAHRVNLFDVVLSVVALDVALRALVLQRRTLDERLLRHVARALGVLQGDRDRKRTL